MKKEANITPRKIKKATNQLSDSLNASKQKHSKSKNEENLEEIKIPIKKLSFFEITPQDMDQLNQKKISEQPELISESSHSLSEIEKQIKKGNKRIEEVRCKKRHKKTSALSVNLSKLPRNLSNAIGELRSRRGLSFIEASYLSSIKQSMADQTAKSKNEVIENIIMSKNLYEKTISSSFMKLEERLKGLSESVNNIKIQEVVKIYKQSQKQLKEKTKTLSVFSKKLKETNAKRKQSKETIRKLSSINLNMNQKINILKAKNGALREEIKNLKSNKSFSKESQKETIERSHMIQEELSGKNFLIQNLNLSNRNLIHQNQELKDTIEHLRSLLNIKENTIYSQRDQIEQISLHYSESLKKSIRHRSSINKRSASMCGQTSLSVLPRKAIGTISNSSVVNNLRPTPSVSEIDGIGQFFTKNDL